MSTIKRKQTLNIVIAVGCLLVGLTLYVLFRPTSLRVFHWADSVGLTEVIGTLRTWVAGFNRYLPAWGIYSIPFALWVSSYLFFIQCIWRDSTSLARHVWFWCIPLIAIAAELAQGGYIIPGQFDLGDIIALILATILSFLYQNLTHSQKGKQNYDKKFKEAHRVTGCFGSVWYSCHRKYGHGNRYSEG